MSERKLVVNQYDHGGARIYFETESDSRHPPASPKRDLIVDCYQDAEFTEWIAGCIRAYYETEPQGGQD